MCLTYGLDALEHDGASEFRWSRRWFGFLVTGSGIRDLALDVESGFENTASIRIDDHPVEHVPVRRGRQVIRLPWPDEVTRHARHVAVELARAWRVPGDPRPLGLRVHELTLTAGRSLHFPARALTRNWPRSTWLASARHFEPAVRSTPYRGRNVALNREERAHRVERVVSTPLKLYLEVAWLCHLRCPTCFHAYLDADTVRAGTHFMSPFVFRTVAEELFPGARMVWFNGNGESLLHPNIETILGTARQYDFVPALLTSGTLFTEANMHALVDGGFFLTVSVDSPWPADFERLRAGARFDRVAAALKHLDDLSRRLKNPRYHLRVQCVAQQANLADLPQLVRWAHEHGAVEVQFLPVQNFGDVSACVERARLDHAPERANVQMMAAVRAGTALGVRVRAFPLLSPDAATEQEMADLLAQNLRTSAHLEEYYAPMAGIPEHPANLADRACHLAWSECFVGADGRIAACDMHLDVTTVGNLYDAGFWETWNGPQMQAMRRTVNDEPEGLCQFGRCMFRTCRPGSTE